MRLACAGLAMAFFVSFPVSCGGSGANKAGGSETGRPLVLTLEWEDDPTQSLVPEFVAAVKRLSGGSMRIALRYAKRGAEAYYERGLVADVRSGKAQLGIVGVRVWDTLGVSSFQALLAPFLVDTLAVERRALASPLAARMLEGVQRAGVVGIALLPGPLRRPFGVSRALVRPDDYRGMRIGSRGRVAGATFSALGAVPRAYPPGALSGLDGVEVDPSAMVYNGWDQRPGGVLTDVVLWPKPYSIVMNRHGFGTLTAGQREILFRAGREARGPQLRRIARDAAAALAEACRRGVVTFATASQTQLATLRRAVQPVYASLERDPLTRKAIAVVERMRSSRSPAPQLPHCRQTFARATAGSSALEGRWRMHWTRAELIASGIPAEYLKGVPPAGWVVYEFRNGRFRTLIDTGRVVGKGTYTVEEDQLNLVYAAPAPTGYAAGQVYRQRWILYRGSLEFSRVPGSDADGVLLVKPLARAR